MISVNKTLSSCCYSRYFILPSVWISKVSQSWYIIHTAADRDSRSSYVRTCFETIYIYFLTRYIKVGAWSGDFMVFRKFLLAMCVPRGPCVGFYRIRHYLLYVTLVFTMSLLVFVSKEYFFSYWPTFFLYFVKLYFLMSNINLFLFMIP